MELKKPNDMFVATVMNPQATTYDLMSTNLNPENTSLYSKDDYKKSKFVQDKFKKEDGSFDDLAFNDYYKLAQVHYELMSNERYLSSLDEVQYSPFDITRPKDAKTSRIEVQFAKDYNPFKQLYGRTGIYSVDDSNLSLRELAQRNKVFDSEKNEWTDMSANDLGFFDKFLGKTLVYAQWDDDGEHVDERTGQKVKHRKGDWKVKNGNLFIETLGNREIYGKQVVNPMDLLTTDGSLANKFDFFDSDSKEKSAVKTTLKLAAEITPFLIPGFNVYYAGVRTAIGLASVLPTFYKSFEGILIGDNKSSLTDLATSAEGYMAKFAASSTSDEAQGSMFNYEQVTQMVSDIFAQIYEQRAAASLSKLFTSSKTAQLTAKQSELTQKVNKEIIEGIKTGKIKTEDAGQILQAARDKIPELKSLQKLQSGMSKSFSLAYMALTTTGDIYGEALESGYDRRTAGFASLAAAAGQYGLMMNNGMGDWFLDKTTGYNVHTNRALIRKSVKEYLKPIEDAFKAKESVVVKNKLAHAFRGIKTKIHDTFTSPTVIGESLFKNAVIEGVEEVSEELVLDATKAIVDVMSDLGLTKKQGHFGAVQEMFSASGFERYLASLVGGVVGGGMFELHRTKIEPWIENKPLTPDTQRSIYELVANGETQTLIDEVNRNKSRLANMYLTPAYVEGEGPQPADVEGISQADVVANIAIGKIKNIENIMRANDLVHTDEEIIKRAMMNSIVIKDFMDSKQGHETGIEGVILEDYKRAANELIRVNTEIKNLSTTEEDKVKNKEEISRLTSEAKLYKSQIDDIYSGKNSEKYYNEMIFYLAKDISKHWLTIDRDTFTKTKYQKDFYSLPETGVGITKERVDKEWKDYLDSKDLRKNIEFATAAYLKLEGDMNKPISSYFESGYADQRKKTFEKLINYIKTIQTFNTNNEKVKTGNLQNFINVVQEIEKETGVRIVPWDAIRTSISDNILNSKMLVKSTIDNAGNHIMEDIDDATLNKVLYKDSEGKPVTLRDQLKNLIELASESLPAEAMSLTTIGSRFNNVELQIYNSRLNSQIEEIKKNNPNWSTSRKISQQISELENAKIDFSIKSYEDTEEYKSQLSLIESELLQKLQDLGLENNQVKAYEYLKGINLDPTTLESFDELKEKGKDGDILQTILNSKIFEIYKNLGDVSIVESIINGTFSDLDQIGEQLDSMKGEIESLLSNADGDLGKSVNEYLKFRTSKTNELTDPKNILDIFKIKNYAIDAILKEIESGNLDKELVDQLSDMIDKNLDNIKIKFFKNAHVSNENLIELLLNFDSVYSEVFDVYTNAEEEVMNYIIDNVNEAANDERIPKYLRDIINEDFSFDLLISNLGELKNFISENSTQNLINQLGKIKEITSNPNKYISNSIYDFLKTFVLSLNDKKSRRASTVIDILKKEELSLLGASDVTNYLAESIQQEDMDQVINAIRMMQSVVAAMQTTTIDFNDVYGFIASRQKFVADNNIDSDTAKLKTVPSDAAELMIMDLERIAIKLQFLKDLAKNNSARSFNEQEIIRERMNDVLTQEWEKLSSKNLLFKGKPVIPDLSEIIKNSTDSEKKLMEIESAIFENHKDLTTDEKKELVDFIKTEMKLSFESHLENLGTIDKDSQILSNFDFALYFGATLSVYSRDFQNKLHNLLKSGFDKAPFYTQELSMKILYASIADPELFSHIVTHSKRESTHLTDRISYVLGGGGTGKTTVIFKMLVEMLKDKNPNMTIWFTGPHTDQTVKLRSDVLKDVQAPNITAGEFNKKQLLDKLNLTSVVDLINTEFAKVSNKETSEIVSIEPDGFVRINLDKINFELTEDVPNLLLIDEITHFTGIELELLNYVASVKNIKIVGAGDNSQSGSIYNDISYNVDRVSGIFSPMLTLTVRAGNNQKRANNDAFYGAMKYINSHFTSEADTTSVLSALSGTLTLRYYKDKTELTGDLLTNEVTSDIWEILKHKLSDGSEKKTLGILVKNEDIDTYKAKLTEYGINEDQVTFFTVDNVQGSERDYFIFDANIITKTRLNHKMKDFYTYMTRARSASVIIKSENFSELNIASREDSTTELVEPLTPEVIAEVKKIREDKLHEILNPNFNLKYDNVFLSESTIEGVTEGSELLDPIFKEEVEQETSSESEVELKGQPEKGSPEDTSWTKDREFSYMFHTFYNNLNVGFTKLKGNKVKVWNNPSKDPSDLNNISFDENVEMSEEEFREYTGSLIKLKYFFLDKVVKSPKTFNTNKTQALFRGVISSNKYLKKVYGENINTKQFKFELVLHSSSYSDVYNKPFDKFNDDQSKHLKDGDKFINLAVKLTDEFGKVTYVSLAAITSLSTAKEYFKNHEESYKKLEEIYANHKNDTLVNPDSVKVLTSTRLEKQKVSPNQKRANITLGQLKNVQGITVSEVKLFPTNEQEFIKVYRKITFGKEIPESKLIEMFNGRVLNGKKIPGYKGKPYVEVSFLSDNSQKQIVLLKSLTRTVKEVSEQSKKLMNNIFKSGQSDYDKKLNQKESESFVSGNQVADMLVKLATQRPELFEKLFDSAFEVPKELSHINFFKSLAGKTPIDYIAWTDEKSTSTLKNVLNEIRSAIKANPKISEADLKSIIVKKAKTEVLWFGKFWNIFKLSDHLILSIEKGKASNYGIAHTVEEKYLAIAKNVNEIIEFWKDEKLYYNLPIETPEKGKYTESKKYQVSNVPLNDKYLYTNLMPEGPRIAINLQNWNIVSGTSSEDAELVALRNQLSSIQFNGSPIFNSESETNKKTIKNQIEKANLIVEILSKNPSLNLDSLRNLTVSKLKETLGNLQKSVETIDDVVKRFEESGSEFLVDTVFKVVENFLANSNLENKEKTRLWSNFYNSFVLKIDENNLPSEMINIAEIIYNPENDFTRNFNQIEKIKNISEIMVDESGNYDEVTAEIYVDEFLKYIFESSDINIC